MHLEFYSPRGFLQLKMYYVDYECMFPCMNVYLNFNHENHASECLCILWVVDELKTDKQAELTSSVWACQLTRSWKAGEDSDRLCRE